MKKNIMAGWFASLSAAAGIAALLTPSNALAVSGLKNPAGVWDCTLTGAHGQNGLAFWQFDENGTFVAYRLFAATKNGLGSSTNVTVQGRNSGDVGRYPGDLTVSSGSGPVSWTNIIGFDTINGTWIYDNKGRVLGSFAEVVGAGQQDCVTNFNISTINATTTVPVQNPDGSVTYYTTNTTLYLTNGSTITCTTNAGDTKGASFVATVSPGKSINIVSSTSNGKVSYHGIVLQPNAVDLSGNWFGTRYENGGSSLETFTLESDIGETGFPNIYFGDGAGPDYGVGVIAFASAHNKIGFAFSDGITNPAPGSVIGTLKKSKAGVLSTTAQGWMLDSASGSPIKYNAVLIPAE